MKKKTRAKRPKRGAKKPARARRRAKPLRIVDARREGGRPTVYVAEYAHIAETMLKSGATEYEVATALGVSDLTVRRWKALHPEFCTAIKVGKEAKLERVERALFHRAVGYTHEATKFFQHGSEVIAVKHEEHYPPDTGACAFYLKNADPAVWKDAHHVTASVHDKRDEIDMTDEELVEVIRKEQALRAAAAAGVAGIPTKT